MLQRTAHAKINLALHVTGQRDDGFHLLDSLVAFAEFGDEITVQEPHHPHGPIEVIVAGPFGEGLPTGAENLITAATVLLREGVIREGVKPKPVSICLTKNLPVASGIGGGSADAAAALLALQEFWGSSVDLIPIAAALGADIPMCLHSKPLRARGIGDEITRLESAQPLNLVLVNPGIAVSTPSVFKQLSDKNNPPIDLLADGPLPDVEALVDMRNDLQQPAIDLVPHISEVLEVLQSLNPLLCRMSGSGATCFGVFKTLEAAIAAEQSIKSARADWWSVATQTTVT